MKERKKAVAGSGGKKLSGRRRKKDGRLTALEKKRIKELRRILAGGEKRRKVPETAQETITFRRLYQNEIGRAHV